MLPGFPDLLFSRSPDEFQDELLTGHIRIILTPGNQHGVCFLYGLPEMPVVFLPNILGIAQKIFGLDLPELVYDTATVDLLELGQPLFKNQLFQELH